MSYGSAVRIAKSQGTVKQKGKHLARGRKKTKRRIKKKRRFGGAKGGPYWVGQSDDHAKTA